MKKIGLYFGSFNPVHIGHMIIANHMVNYSDLDEIWMVVSPQNPFKKKSSLLEDRKRYNLVDLAIGDNLKLKASDVEFDLEQPSYTVNTLEYIKEKYPDKEFSLIMGRDNLDSFHKWKNYEQIIKNNAIITTPYTIKNQQFNYRTSKSFERYQQGSQKRTAKKLKQIGLWGSAKTTYTALEKALKSQLDATN